VNHQNIPSPSGAIGIGFNPHLDLVIEVFSAFGRSRYGRIGRSGSLAAPYLTTLVPTTSRPDPAFTRWHLV
jgi:hypothetical protein